MPFFSRRVAGNASLKAGIGPWDEGSETYQAGSSGSNDFSMDFGTAVHFVCAIFWNVKLEKSIGTGTLDLNHFYKLFCILLGGTIHG